jgi:hypothetical protein
MEKEASVPDHFFRVCAALRAAATRPALPFVRIAFLAAALRELLPRRRAALCACRASAVLEAALRPSRRKAERTARDRLADGFVLDRLRLRACSALRLVSSDVCPFFGGRNFTPARRAFDRPMAIACFVDRAPCLPFRTWCISSRTNSPACVAGDLPARLSRRALSTVSFSGMITSGNLQLVSSLECVIEIPITSCKLPARRPRSDRSLEKNARSRKHFGPISALSRDRRRDHP